MTGILSKLQHNESINAMKLKPGGLLGSLLFLELARFSGDLVLVRR